MVPWTAGVWLSINYGLRTLLCLQIPNDVALTAMAFMFLFAETGVLTRPIPFPLDELHFLGQRHCIPEGLMQWLRLPDPTDLG